MGHNFTFHYTPEATYSALAGPTVAGASATVSLLGSSNSCVSPAAINASVSANSVGAQLSAITVNQGFALEFTPELHWYERIVNTAATVSSKATALDFLNKLSKGDRSGARQIAETFAQGEGLAITLQALLAISRFRMRSKLLTCTGPVIRVQCCCKCRYSGLLRLGRSTLVRP